MLNTRLVLIKFKIRGNLRFLSHAETVKVFQRACVRAGIKTAYSQGFNPRPKLSLPLPRSVGVESDGDLLSLQVNCVPAELQVTSNESPPSGVLRRIKARLSEQLPEGCELLSVSSVAKTKSSAQPSAATYVLTVRRECLDDRIKDRIEHLLASKTLNMERRKPRTQNYFVDVRPFLKSIELNDKGIVVEYKISSAGSIRVDEILELLGLDAEKLTAPIRRTSVQWQQA